MREFLIAGLAAFTSFASAQTNSESQPAQAPSTNASAIPRLEIDAGKVTGHVSPVLYGLMTEEINHSYDGGLYAELIRNRAFLDNPRSPDHWSVVNDNGAEAAIALDPGSSFNDKLTNSLRLTVTKASKKQHAGVANEGYWGIPV